MAEKTGFQTLTGKVTVDLENKNTPKSDISYVAFVVENDEYPDLATVAQALLQKGVTQDVAFETRKGTDGKEEKKVSGISLVQLLIEGYKNFQRTVATADAKSRFNNSPAKVESSMAKELRALLGNPDATTEQKARAEKMLALLTA